MRLTLQCLGRGGHCEHRAAQGSWWGLQMMQLAFCSSVDFSTQLGLNGEIYIIMWSLAWSLEFSVRQGGLWHVLISRKLPVKMIFEWDGFTHFWRWKAWAQSLLLFRRCISQSTEVSLTISCFRLTFF